MNFRDSDALRPTRATALASLLGALAFAPYAAAQNSSQLAENGWFSDDTRADGTGSEAAGANLISTGLTDAPEGPTGSTVGDSDLRSQISFGPAPGVVPAGTHRGAIHLDIGPSGSGKSQISHRIDDGVGHGAGDSILVPGMNLTYSWLGDGTPTVTASFKLGFKTADFGATGSSSRTGENVWDKVLIYEPGNGNGETSDGTWKTETADFTTGAWWFFDRTEGASTIGAPMTLASMAGSPLVIGTGTKTVGDVFALMTAPGAHVTSVQFGIGSGNADGSVYINELETNFYRAGSTTTFGKGLLQFDEDVTNNAIFGSGNGNGSFTVDRSQGMEIGLRGKLRFDDNNLPAGIYNSNGDGTYTFPVGAPTGGAGWVTAATPRWNVEWSINTDFDGTAGATLDGFTYELGLDIDPGPGTNFIQFDPIDPLASPFSFWDHSIGDNGTATGAGAEATDPATYAALIANNNLAQNSWNIEFFNDAPFDTFDPNTPGRYDVYLAAFDGSGTEVARSNAAILAVRSLEFDQDVTNEVIFGSGNANGAFTTDRASGVEVALRNKVRFPAPLNVFNSNGDGTYTYNTGTSGGSNPFWSFEWSANTDTDGTAGRSIDGLTYELGLDYDPTPGTDYLRFDPISPGSVIPYATPFTVPFWDHAIGDNSTINGGGASAGDEPTYLGLIGANNLVQNSWRYTFFDEPPFSVDPNVPGQYEMYLAAFEGGVEVARTEITTFALDGASLTLEADPCQTDQRPGIAGVQIEAELRMRNLGQSVTGYQAFLQFDPAIMMYEGAASAYEPGPFGLNIQAIATAEVAPGELRLDGSAAPSAPGTAADTLLATLVFTVPDCSISAVNFDLGQAFSSELSFLGTPIATSLLGGISIQSDASAPVIAASADIVVSADAGVGTGCDSAVVNYPIPAVVDTCSAVTLVCTPPTGTAFPAGETTQVTCVATDECGNQSVETFSVTVTETHMFTVEVELIGVQAPISRCLNLATDDCSSVDVVFDFIDHDANAATPVRALATVEIPCGNTGTVCIKDEQHTLWSTTTVTLSGVELVADSLVQLEGGDTDNDGDVDINDVTLFIAQFGSLAAPGGCGWDGTRDADFDNDGAVGSADYTFLTSNWLRTSSCSCTAPSGGPVDDQFAFAGFRSQRAMVSSALSHRADGNGDGWVDVRDVMIFERRNGLSGGLSRAILRAPFRPAHKVTR